jgi:hypothetical protein
LKLELRKQNESSSEDSNGLWASNYG